MFQEGLYLLRKNEFIQNNQHIYKFGRSKTILNRMNNYSNGSLIYLLISCNDTNIHEHKILELFQKKYTMQLYYGSEYFLGNAETMKEDIINYVSNVMQDKGYQIVNNNVLIERVNKHTNKKIPKLEQELYKIQITSIPPTNIISNNNDKDKQLNDLCFNTNKTLINKYISIKSLSNDSEEQITNTLQENILNATITNLTNTNTNSNNQTLNINTNNNQITINNKNKINVVYPFGYENIYFLSVNEMIDILASKNSIIAAIENIFSNVENQNFMKRNMNKNQMTVIDEKCNIKVMNDDVFKKKIITNTFNSLQLMFYHCKNMLRIEYQIILWKRLRLLDDLINENIPIKKEKHMHVDISQIMDTITNMVAENNENPEYREKFAEIKNSIFNEEYKKLFNEKINIITDKIAELNKDFQTRNNQICNHNSDIEPSLKLSNPIYSIKPINSSDIHNLDKTQQFMFILD